MTDDEARHDAEYQCSTDSRDLLEKASDIISFMVQATADANENGLSRSGAFGLCYILDHCNTLIRRAGCL